MTDEMARSELLERARRGDGRALGELLEAYRTGLHRQATRQLDGRLAARIDPSDIIQLTFLEAHRNLPQFQGADERDWRAWLEGILDHNVASVLRDHTRTQKRDIRREQSLDDSQGKAAPLKHQLDDGQSSPSHRLMRSEEADHLRSALEGLPPEQRLAVRLRHLEGWPLLEIAEQLGRTPAATAGLIKRGMQTLRKHLHHEAE